MVYAKLDSNGIVVGISTLYGSVEDRDLVEIDAEDQTLLGQRWTGTAFESRHDPRPQLRIIADQTRIWESTPGQALGPNHVAMLTGQLLDAKGQPDPTATLPETVIEIQGASGKPSLILIRATAGVVEICIRGQWVPTLPFVTENSGRYDVAVMLGAYFNVVDGPVIEVLRG